MLELYSEIALSGEPFGIGHKNIQVYSVWLKMTDTLTSQNIDLPSWALFTNEAISS
jgi:hypothetical protein